MLDFALQSCPLLEKIFLLYSNIFVPGVINLDLKGHQFLQPDDLNMANCRYYTFDHEPGKYWRNKDQQIMQDALTAKSRQEFPSHHVNLAWDTTKLIGIRLAGCKAHS